MLKSRRGLLAAGLAVAVASSVGVISTLDAGAEQIAATPAPSTAVVPSPVAGTDEDVVPPALLPWGSRPKPVKKGRPGASSTSLRGTDFDVAPADASGAVKPRARYGPKGRMSRTTYLKSERTTIAPPEPAGAGAAAPTSTVKYHYARGFQHVDNDGASATLTIAKPRLDDQDYHTLAEIAVQSGPDDEYRQIVEVGWTVDRVINGDDDPHLFVYHWVNKETSCYNGCGFVQYSRNVKPGDTLKYGVSKKFGIQYFDGNWWVAYDSEWIGYFPEALWNRKGVKFNRAKLVQVFGEVASPSDRPCGTQMGNGQLPFTTVPLVDGIVDNLAAARIASATIINVNPTTGAAVGSAANLAFDPPSASNVYHVKLPDVKLPTPAPTPTQEPAKRSFLYGGPDYTGEGSPCRWAN